MEMRVRAYVLAVVLIVLGAGSVFGQSGTTAVGAPAGSVYNGANDTNLAVAREGNREFGAPVTICALTGGSGAANAANGTNATFDTNDVFQIRYSFAGGAANDPILATTGALGATNLQVFQSAGTATQGATASATAAMFQPPSIGGAVPGPQQALVTVTITAGPTAAGQSGINCVTVQGIRFDIGNTAISGTVVGPPPAAAAIIATVNQTAEGFGGVALAAPVLVPVAVTPALTAGTTGVGSLNPGMPAPPSNAVGTVVGTLSGAGTGSLIANPTGYITAPGGGQVGAVVGGAVTVQGNNPTGASGAASTVPRLTQGAVTPSGAAATASGTLSIEENAIPAGVNLPVVDGGGMLRGLVAAGPDTTTWLNAAGNTTGTQVILTISGMPTGSSVTFASTASSAQSAAVVNLSLVGSGTVAAPGGTVTYVTGINEGGAGTLGAAGSQIGPDLAVPFTVTVGGGAGTARVIISVGPVSGASAVPTYSAVNGGVGAAGGSVFPSQLSVAGVIPTYALFSVGSNQTTRTYPYALFTGGTTSSDYDTGVVLNNAGKFSSTALGVASQVNIGQDGPFTIFLLSSSSTVTSIRSTGTCSGGGAFPGSSLLSSGNLKQGDTWQALTSEITKCAGITGAWRGQLVIVADIPNTSGFVFISQFTNASGGATMGYIAQ